MSSKQKIRFKPSSVTGSWRLFFFFFLQIFIQNIPDALGDNDRRLERLSSLQGVACYDSCNTAQTEWAWSCTSSWNARKLKGETLMCSQWQGYRRISSVMSESSVPETAWPLQNNSLTLLKGFAMNLKRATENGKKNTKPKHCFERPNPWRWTGVHCVVAKESWKVKVGTMTLYK